MSGTSAERLSRLLALVPWLVQHDGVTLAACAEHFGVSEEQLQADLELLIVCGLPGYGPDQLVDIQFWDDDLEIHVDEPIHVLDAQTLARPLRLSQEEALTLLVALRMLAQVPGVGSRDAITSAAVKLEQAARAEGASRYVVIEVAVDPAVRDAVDEALAGQRTLVIRYGSAARDEVTDRTVEPRRLFTVDGVSYLEAYCRSAEAVRTFRLDRVIAASVGPDRVEAAPPPEPDDTPPTPPSAHVVLDLTPAARWVIDVHHATVLAPEPGGASRSSETTRVRVPTLSQDWAVRLVLSLRGDATVVEPAHLALDVAAAAAAALAGYAGEVP